MDENKIRALGYFINRVLLGVAAIVGSCKAPQAISDYAVNVKTEQIMNNAISNVVKVVSSIKNENHNTVINQYRDKLHNALENPNKFKKELNNVPEPVLKQLGMRTSKADLSLSLEKSKTTGDLQKVLIDELPSVLLDAQGKPFVLDESHLGQ